jgi:WS/DGAT/MGAT family acyltransferase
MTGVLADERMSDVDALVWNVEQTPRNRTTIAALARFADPLDPVELRHRVDRASRVVPRLRQRVISDARSIASPRWSLDPDFRLSAHLRTLRLADADDVALAEVVRDLVIQPFDRSRPLWEFTHVSGLEGGGEALLLKSHHAVSDGVGGIEMMLELFDIDPDPESTGDWPRLPPVVTAPDDAASPASLTQEASTALAGIRAALDRFQPPDSLGDIASASRRLGETLGSAARMFAPGRAAGVPSARSDDLELRFLSLPLDDLRTAGRRVDGSVNDAFVGAVAIGTAAYFDTNGDAPLRVSVPINTRTGDAGGAGNHWTPGRIDVDTRLAADCLALMTAIGRSVRRARSAPAHRLLEPLASTLSRLPAAAAAGLFATFSSSLDVAASNVPGSPLELHLCGRPVEAMIPFGPLSGCAVNVTLLSHAGTAHIGIASDPAAVADPDRLRAEIRAGFDRITGGST